MSKHTIKCRETGKPLANKLGGGDCVCKPGECEMRKMRNNEGDYGTESGVHMVTLTDLIEKADDELAQKIFATFPTGKTHLELIVTLCAVLGTMLGRDAPDLNHLDAMLDTTIRTLVECAAKGAFNYGRQNNSITN